MDPLAGVSIFPRVVETGSFTAAARRLRIAKATASAQVDRLEKRLGVRLLHRSTRHVAPTEAGQAYFERVADLLAALAEAEKAALALQREPRGHLPVSAPDEFGEMYVAPLVADFLASRPQLALDL